MVRKADKSFLILILYILQITAEQRQVVDSVMTDHQVTALYVKLTFDLLLSWRSYFQVCFGFNYKRITLEVGHSQTKEGSRNRVQYSSNVELQDTTNFARFPMCYLLVMVVIDINLHFFLPWSSEAIYLFYMGTYPSYLTNLL